MRPQHISIINRIAGLSAADELLVMRALGAPWDASFISGCHVIDEILKLAREPARPAVWPKGSEPR